LEVTSPKNGPLTATYWKAQMASPRSTATTTDKMLGFLFAAGLLFAGSSQLSAGAAPNPRAEELYRRSLSEGFTVLGRNAAIKHINEALAIDGDNALYWRQKGCILSSMDEHEQALPCFEKSIKLNPNDSATWSVYCTTLSNLDRYPEALAAIDKSFKIYNDPNCRITKSAVLMKLQRYAEAENELDIVLKSDPKNRLARVRRPQVSTHLAHWDKIIEDTSFSLSPGTPRTGSMDEVYETRGKAYTQKKMYDQAINDYKNALKERPLSRQLHKELLAAYKLKGDAAGVRSQKAEIEALDEDLRPLK